MEIVRVEDSDLKVIEANRCRVFRAMSLPLNAQVIWDDIYAKQRQRVMIICNTVSQAQGIYRDLSSLNHDWELNITLLHARFLPEHRANKENYLTNIFAENWQNNSDNTCHVLIATQVIEAGINITCEVLHTQLCPMNSLLQRAGRCARFSGESGEVFVYRNVEINQKNQVLANTDLFDWEDADVEKLESEKIEITKPKESFLPYKKEICELTWQVLQAHTESEKVNHHVGFRIEEEWINLVHAEEDSLFLKRRSNSQMEFESRFTDAIFRGDESAASDLIRKVDNRNIFTWSESGLIDCDDGQEIDIQKLLPFSVPISTLCKAWRDFQESLAFGDDWIFKRIETPKNKSQTYSQPVLSRITSRDFLIGCYRILVNNRYIYYDEEIGLQIGVNIPGNRFNSPHKREKIIASQYRYRMDNYVGHLVLMWKCWRDNFSTKILKNGEVIDINYRSVRDELLVAGGKFIKAKILPQAEVNEAEALFEILVFLAIFTHDLGKLQVKWQQVMREWQKIAHHRFKGKNPRQYLLAHTDYNPEDEVQKAALKAFEKKNQRPNHAVESAFLAREILHKSLIPLLQEHFTEDTEQIKYFGCVVIMAAGRHHSAWARGFESNDVAKLKQIELSPKSQQVIADSWRCMTKFLPDFLPLSEGNLSRNVYQLKELDLNEFFTIDEVEFLQLYSLVVRALRLCDQRSVQF
ncbi:MULTISPECIES: CRISPR-associated helicase Cas3' [Calothrix]|uniref:CRISPR-associated helicase Cas3 n=2 Tax=Calothrix TaxID=1186 RepID=A0ABR8AKX7_9CYAN|nr:MULTISPECIES: CRISPR-associated helicase Cas3' [Calothrix]MBD2200673.1 CRISPR-associated helicase Cas3' [Calothrix parietina FACHB-288]MBD2229711.1 CRISPR-associated helicase Cas3' [Calothrix anomala FACHB-343]